MTEISSSFPLSSPEKGSQCDSPPILCQRLIGSFVACAGHHRAVGGGGGQHVEHAGLLCSHPRGGYHAAAGGSAGIRAKLARDGDRRQNAGQFGGARVQPDGHPAVWRHPAAHAAADAQAHRPGTTPFLYLDLGATGKQPTKQVKVGRVYFVFSV